MFEELQSYLDDDIGASSSSDLKECTIEFHGWEDRFAFKGFEKKQIFGVG